MLEAVGDLWAWEPPCPHTEPEHTVDVCVANRRVDARVITTNGYVNARGRCTMGAGVAKDARDRFPGVDVKLGQYIAQYGNRCFTLGVPANIAVDWHLVTYPVKHNYWERADPVLMQEGAEQLVLMADKHEWDRVVLPRAGCGSGGLSWSDVRPVLEPILDDRFTVVSLEGQ